MQIKLRNFRCHLDSEYTILNNHVTLVKGASGAGKSTVFQGLAWCLYGGMQHVYNNVNPLKCHVQVTIDNLVIYRQKKPELFRVTYDGKIYEDDVAQGIIDNFFGTKEVWYACCYVPQNNRNTLLSASNADKMKLIHQLSFNTENPEAYITRIESELAEKQKQLAINQGIYTRDCADLSTAIGNSNLDLSLYLSQGDSRRNDIPSNITSLQQQLVDLRVAEAYQNQLKGQIQLLTKSLSGLGYDNGNDSEASETELARLENELRGYQEQFARAQIYKQLVEVQKQLQHLSLRLGTYQDITETYTEQDLINIGSLHSKLDQNKLRALQQQVEYTKEAITKKISELQLQSSGLDVSYNEQDLIRASSLLEKQNRGQLIAQRYQIAYTREDIANKINELQEQLRGVSYTEADLLQAGALQEKQTRGRIIMERYGLDYSNEALQQGKNNVEYYLAADRLRTVVTTIGSFQAQLAALEVPETVIRVEDLGDLDDKISQAQISSSLLRCPHCSQSVRYLEGKLHSSTTEPISPRLIECLLQERVNLTRLFKVQELRQQVGMKIQEHYSLLQQKFSMESSLQSRHNSLEDFISKLPTLPVVPSQVLTELMSIEVITNIPSLELIRADVEKARQLRGVITDLSMIEVITDVLSIELIKASLENRRTIERNNIIITELQRIEVIENLPSLSLVKRSIEKGQLSREYERLVQQERSLGNLVDGSYDLAAIEQKINLVTVQLKQHQELISQARDAKRRRVDLTNHLREVEEKRDDNYISRISEVERQLQRYQLQIQVIEKYDDLLRRKDQLEKLQATIYSVHRHVTQLEKLREVAVTVEVSALQCTVDSINNVIDDIAPLLFNDPITIRLSLFKTLKTKEKTKPLVNLVILYRGGEYDNISQLSGGEGDRVSLIITLALSRLCNFPLLLFDESLASLDGDLKESAIRAVRIATQKAVACVMHEGVEGIYDNVIVVG